MPLNARTKGHDFERALATKLNSIIDSVLLNAGFAVPTIPIVQRNQNQSAVGGDDLIGTFGLSVEAKACETLCIPEWWRQCTTSATRRQQEPVLIYKQNRKPWRVMMYVDMYYPYMEFRSMRVPAIITFDVFEKWFKDYIEQCINRGWVPTYK